MGVTISYRGRLRRPEDVDPLVEELADICQSAGWKFNFLDFKHLRKPKDGDEPFYGVTFQPHPECESVWMLFNERGELSHPFAARVDSDPNPLPWSWTKTQFAGSGAHVAICRLFRYLEKAWFAEFEVRDEGEYWETGDETELAEASLNYTGEMLDAIAEEYEALRGQPGETVEGRLTGILLRLWEQRKPPPQE